MKRFIVRLLNLITGLFLFSLGIIISLKANIGYAPWEVFHIGLAKTIGLSFGSITAIVGIIIVAIVTLLGEKFGLGTILNVFLISAFLDIIMTLNIIPTAKNFAIGIMMLISGLFIISLGSYFYIKSAFGSGPRDNLMIVLARKTKFPVGLCRGFIEFAVTLTGWLLGGMVGIGTAISVIGISFFIQITFGILKFDVTAVKHESLADTYKAFFGKKTG